ncbi:hypothetical protein MFIFM68171_04693 [Madurella fahalii]|uniref:Heterokaryon incompatibility domain-containing protein n=1 Tax=Madurella fahalii TaxID=1157608 RepID=A0ABQ0G9P1_9PEZI
MATDIPTRLLGLVNDEYFVFDTQDPSYRDKVKSFDIVSYRWGRPVSKYDCKIRGVDWHVTIPGAKLDDIQNLMKSERIRYMWADCVCIKAGDEADTAKEIANMYAYYQKAERCHILVDVEQAVAGATIVLDSKALTLDLSTRLANWADDKKTPWAFPLGRSTVASAAIDAGLLNCYATCIDRITSLFENEYFSRVWTFQELLLGKQICMWGVSEDKAEKLQRWIETSRVHKTDAINAVLAVIRAHQRYLISLQARVRGIRNARTDIITGGPSWWVDNPGGVSNIFSAVSIMPRECTDQKDVFRGLLGIFNGIFDAGEIETYMQGDMNRMTFEFFRRLSKRTGYAWTRLVLSGKRQTQPGWDWIPVVAENGRPTTDCFAGVANLGALDNRGAKTLVVSNATTVAWVSPRPYVDVTVRRIAERDGDYGSRGSGFRFSFRGCNYGKSGKSPGGSSGTGTKEPERCQDVTADETGRFLVRCGTILGHLLDPGHDIGEYRRRLFGGLGPVWKPTDANAKPIDWVDRCVSGTYLATASHFRVHNESAHYRMAAITKCQSRLYNNTAEKLESATSDDNGRITLTDRLGLVQVEETEKGKEHRFRLIALQGSADAYSKHAGLCRSTPLGRPVDEKTIVWPKGRALVDGNFSHRLTATLLRRYGFVETGGAGKLLLCRSHPLAHYRVMGICIDEAISDGRKDNTDVTIDALGHSSAWPGITDILRAMVESFFEWAQPVWLEGLRIAGELASKMRVVYERIRPSVVKAFRGIKIWLRPRG